VILIGHAGHPEIEGTIGQLPAPVHLIRDRTDVDRLDLPADAPVAYITQTTLSVDDTRATIDALKARFADIVGPDTRDICYATHNRQAAVRELIKVVDVLLVVGATNSSNSNRLREIGADAGIPSYLVADRDELDREWFAGKATIGLTAGASAPEVLVQDVIDALSRLGPVELAVLRGIDEKIRFPLPAELGIPPGAPSRMLDLGHA
jgi:4-hydroxy-3-methylbut-2-enyl diphosphate reductase